MIEIVQIEGARKIIREADLEGPEEMITMRFLKFLPLLLLLL